MQGILTDTKITVFFSKYILRGCYLQFASIAPQKVVQGCVSDVGMLLIMSDIQVCKIQERQGCILRGLFLWIASC